MSHRHPANVARHDERTRGDKATDALAKAVGSWPFVIAQNVVVAAWITFNMLAVFRWHWDPYPFILLNLVFSWQASNTGPVLQMAQNRQSEHDRHRAEADYAVNERSFAAVKSLQGQVAALAEALGIPGKGKARMKALRAGGRIRGVPDLASAGPVVLMADVSEWNPEIADAVYLNWSKAVIVRALYGDAHDDAAWYGGQRRALLHEGGARFVGIYAFLVASQPAVAQAQAFKALVGDIRPGEVFIADFEQGDHALLTGWYNAMIAEYGQAIGPYLWTYAGLFFGQETGALPVQWIADYAPAEPCSPHVLWQFTDGYLVPGVGRADCSLFHGTIDDLAALAYPAAAPPPAPPWTFAEVGNLTVLGAGPHSVKLSWDAPAGTEPLGIGWYELALSEGDKLAADVPSYPRTDPKGTSPEVWQGGSLTPATTYTAGVRAVATDGAHASPWATATFTTAAAAKGGKKP